MRLTLKMKRIQPLPVIMTYDNGDYDDDDGYVDDDDDDDEELSVIPGSLPCHNLRDDCCARHRAFAQRYDDDDEEYDGDNIVNVYCDNFCAPHRAFVQRYDDDEDYDDEYDDDNVDIKTICLHILH